MHKSRRIWFLIVFFIVFFVIAPAVVLYALGYRINQGGDDSSAQFTPTGGLSVRTSQKLRVYLDGTYLAQTPLYRAGLQAGIHTVSLQKEGFQTWTKDLTFSPYVVTEIENTILFPKNLSFSDLNRPTSTEITSLHSPQQSDLILYESASSQENSSESASTSKEDGSPSNPQLTLYSPQQDKFSQITEATSLPERAIQDIIWGQNTDQFLVRFKAEPSKEIGEETYVVTDLNQETPTVQNITSLFPYKTKATPISYISLVNNTVTLVQGGHMFEINILNKDTSTPIVSNVRLLKSTASQIVYVDDTSGDIIVFDRGSSEEKTTIAQNINRSISRLYISPSGNPYIITKDNTVFGQTKSKNALSEMEFPASQLIFAKDGSKMVFKTSDQLAVRYTKQINTYVTREKGESERIYQSGENTSLSDVQWLPMSQEYILFKENGTYHAVELDTRGSTVNKASITQANRLIPSLQGRNLVFYALQNKTLQTGSFPIQREGLFRF